MILSVIWRPDHFHLWSTVEVAEVWPWVDVVVFCVVIRRGRLVALHVLCFAWEGGVDATLFLDGPGPTGQLTCC